MLLHIPPSFLLGLIICTNFGTFFSSLANSLRLLRTDRSNTGALFATSCVPTAVDFCKGDSIIFARVPMHLPMPACTRQPEKGCRSGKLRYAATSSCPST
ncbi:hypothetical protein MRB53_024641 [Persea americana]|uniref:Uncharacterized protein n=1 Tax=Persea americana TaxID=3435 RepID=A0ACC2LE09_PERAE|nr:hypothetical protein MRB53_024641 [Persea americana]